MRRTYSFLLILIGLGIVGVLFLSLGLQDIIVYISRLSSGDLFLLLIVQAIILVLSAMKWWIILEDEKVSFNNVLSISLVGYLVNGLIPVSSGEPVRAYLLSKIENIQFKKALSSVFVDFFLSVIPIIFLTLAVAFMAISLYDTPLFLTSFLIVLSILAISTIFIMVGIIRKANIIFVIMRHITGLFGFFPDSIKRFLNFNELELSLTDFSLMTSNRLSKVSLISKNLSLSFLIRGLSLVRTYIIFSILGFADDPLAIIIVRVLVDAIALFSIIPGAVGIWEVTSTLLFTIFGVPATVAFSASFIDRFYSYWISNLIGAFASIRIGAIKLIKDMNQRR